MLDFFLVYRSSLALIVNDLSLGILTIGHRTPMVYDVWDGDGRGDSLSFSSLLVFEREKRFSFRSVQANLPYEPIKVSLQKILLSVKMSIQAQK